MCNSTVFFLVPIVELHINYCSAVFRGNIQLESGAMAILVLVLGGRSCMGQT